MSEPVGYKCEGKCVVEVSRASGEFPGAAGLPPFKYRQGYYTGQTCDKPEEPPEPKPDDNNTDNGGGGGGDGGGGDGGGGGGGDGGGKPDGNPDGNPDGEEGGKGRFGGNCNAGFNCKGDAVQCAIARELHDQYCRYNKPNNQSREYDKATGEAGGKGSVLNELPGSKEIDLGGSGRWDTSDAIGGGRCISDLNITVMGNSVTLPFSDICPNLEYLGNILIFVTAIICVVIVVV